MTRITDLKFLTLEEQDKAFSMIHSGISRLVIQGRVNREANRTFLDMLTKLEKVWFFQQIDVNGVGRTENRPMP